MSETAELIRVLERIANGLEGLERALVPEQTTREAYHNEKPTPYLEQLIDALHEFYPLKRAVATLEREVTELRGLQQSFAASATVDHQQLRQRLELLEREETKQ